MSQPWEPIVAMYRPNPLEEFAGRAAGHVRSKLRPGASSKTLAAAEKKLGFALPPTVRALYRTCDGVVVPKTDRKLAPYIRLLPLQEAVALHRQLASLWGTPFRYFAFTDTNDSDPYAVICDGSLKGRILHIRHDDEWYPAFRSLRSFLRAVWRLAYHLAPTTTDLLREWHDYALWTPARTAADDAAGMKLLHSAASPRLTSEWRDCWRRWAAAMIAAERINELPQILDSGDDYPCSAAIERLSHIEAPRAAAVLRRFENERKAFLRRCRNELAAAGFQVLKEEGDVFSIRRMSGGFAPMSYFGARRKPHVFADIVQRVREIRVRDSSS